MTAKKLKERYPIMLYKQQSKILWRNNKMDGLEICRKQLSCETCPNFDECYSLDDEILDDYETMEPDESLDKYLWDNNNGNKYFK